MNRLVGIFSLLCCVAVSALAQSVDSLTGCLGNGGQLGKFAIGNSPSSPCSPQEKQISIKNTAAAGPSGTLYLKMARETEKIVAAFGPFTITAKCTAIDSPGNMKLTFQVTSTVGGWFITLSDQSGYVGPNGVGSLDGIFGVQNPIGSPSLAPIGSFALRADSHSITIADPVVGVNIYGADCVFIGVLSSGRASTP